MSTATATTALQATPITTAVQTQTAPMTGASIPLGNLLTTFIPPSSCFDRYYAGLDIPFDTQSITSGTLDPLFAGCQKQGNNFYQFSPGMCPGRMQPATSYTRQSDFAEICCQTGFSFDFRGCVSSLAGTTIVPYYSSSFKSSRTVTSAVAAHQPITVYWRSEDLSSFPANIASSRSNMLASINTTAITSPPATSAVNATLTTSNENDDNSNAVNSDAGVNLSLPARIGIGVGVAIGGLIILIVLSAWLCKVRRRRRNAPFPARNGAKELDGAQPIWKRLFGGEWRAELPQGDQVAELETERGPAELTGRQIPVELPGSYQFLNPVTEAGENKIVQGEANEKKENSGNTAP